MAPGAARVITEHARRLRDRLRAAAMRGGAKECRACGARLRGFLASGARLAVLRKKDVIGCGYRQGNACPVCRATDRERLALAFVAGSPDFHPDNGAVLHLAPEPGIARFFGARPGVAYITADYLRPSMSVALDLQALPFSEACFDAIICNHVLEHVRDDRRAMAEIRRVMKPGARALLQVPVAASEAATHEDETITAPAAREAAFGQSDHVRLYGRDYGARLEQAGFSLELIDWRQRRGIFGADAERYGFNPREVLYVATRP